MAVVSSLESPDLAPSSATPVGVAISTATITVTANLSEETLQNVNLAWGNAGSIAVTPAGAGQPGKSVLTLSTTFQNVAVAIVGLSSCCSVGACWLPDTAAIRAIAFIGVQLSP